MLIQNSVGLIIKCLKKSMNFFFFILIFAMVNNICYFLIFNVAFNFLIQI